MPTHDPTNEQSAAPHFAGAQAEIASRFASMMRLANEREAQFTVEMDAADDLGPCPACGRGIQPLDEAETLERSVQRNRLTLVYEPCHGCMQEAQTQERLARYGVPRRTRHATFANFETAGETDGRAEALEQVRQWVRDRECAFLLLLGSCGSGKGHLASAAVRAMASPSASATWTTHAELIDGYYAASMERKPGYLVRHQRVPLLVLDEMGGKGMTNDTVEIFYKILERRYDTGLRTILIGNIPLRAKDPTKPSMITLTGGERMESRLKHAGICVTCRWPDYRAKKSGIDFTSFRPSPLRSDS